MSNGPTRPDSTRARQATTDKVTRRQSALPSPDPMVESMEESEAEVDFLPMILAAVGLGSTVAVQSGVSKLGKLKIDAVVEDATAMPDRDSTNAWLPRVSLMLMALLCSTNFTTLKILGEGRNEAVVAAVRFALAMLPFLPVLHKHAQWSNIKSGVEIGLWCALGYVAQAVGLQTATASHGAFICSLTMVVIPVAKSLMGEEVSKQLWGSVALAATGTSLLMGLVGGDGAPVSAGDIICGGCALGFGMMFVRMDHYASKKEFDPVGCTAWQTVALAASMALWAAATLGPGEAVSEVSALLSEGPTVVATLAWLGLVSTGLVLYVETLAMEEVDGTEAGIIFASEPVWATIFASVVLGETLGAKEGAGAVLILLACLVTQVRLGDEKGEDPVALPAGATASTS